MAADLTKITADITAFIAEYQSVKAERDQLLADKSSQDTTDQAAVDALDAQVAAVLPAPVVEPTDGSTPIGDSIPA